MYKIQDKGSILCKAVKKMYNLKLASNEEMLFSQPFFTIIKCLRKDTATNFL